MALLLEMGAPPLRLSPNVGGLEGRASDGSCVHLGADFSIVAVGLRAPKATKIGIIDLLIELYHKGVDYLADVVDGVLRHNEFVGEEVRATSHCGRHHLSYSRVLIWKRMKGTNFPCIDLSKEKFTTTRSLSYNLSITNK